MRRLLVFAVTFALVACSGGDSGTGPGSSPYGTYQLQTINGKPLPVEIFGSTTLSGTLTLRADNTYRSESVVRTTDIFTGQVATETDVETGSFTQNGNSLHVIASDGGQADVAYDGSSLTLDAGLFVAVYRR